MNIKESRMCDRKICLLPHCQKPTRTRMQCRKEVYSNPFNKLVNPSPHSQIGTSNSNMGGVHERTKNKFMLYTLSLKCVTRSDTPNDSLVCEKVNFFLQK